MNKLYDFQSVVAVKFLVKKDDLVLVLKEPETNEWMPGRLSLPGGKPLLNETLLETMDRKIRTEVGLNIKINGFSKIINILMSEKNVYHIIFLADYLSGKIGENTTESDQLSWLSLDDLNKLSVDDFAEYYYKNLLTEFFQGKLKTFPLNFLEIQDNRSGKPNDWLNKVG